MQTLEVRVRLTARGVVGPVGASVKLSSTRPLVLPMEGNSPCERGHFCQASSPLSLPLIVEQVGEGLGLRAGPVFQGPSPRLRIYLLRPNPELQRTMALGPGAPPIIVAAGKLTASAASVLTVVLSIASQEGYYV